jgi:hypothetical protein
LRAADIDTPTTLHIGRDLGGTNHTIGTWRRRFVTRGLSGVQDAARSGRPRTIVSSPRVQVISLASTLPKEQDRPVTRWTCEAIGATLRDALHTPPRSRSRVWRILHAIDLQPHNSADWLNSHEEHCAAKARAICPRDVHALTADQQGHLLICCDEKPGMQVLERQAPTKPAHPGRRARRAHEDIRHGTRVLIHSLAVATGHMAWTLGATRKPAAFVAHLKQVSPRLPPMPRYAWMMDNLHTQWSLAIGRVVAQWCQGPLDPTPRKTGAQRRVFWCDPSQRQVLHCTPTHGAWLHQAEWFFGVLHRRFLARGSCRSVAECASRRERFWQDSHTRHAQPYRWTSTGEPLGRDTPLSRTRRQPCRGRACLSPHPKRFERLRYAPRPSHRRAASLVMDIRNALLA